MLESPYTLEPDYEDSSYSTILGGTTSINPGKNELNQFKYFFDASAGRWRYTYSRPLKKMEYINAATHKTVIDVSVV